MLVRVGSTVSRIFINKSVGTGSVSHVVGFIFLTRETTSDSLTVSNLLIGHPWNNSSSGFVLTFREQLSIACLMLSILPRKKSANVWGSWSEETEVGSVELLNLLNMLLVMENSCLHVDEKVILLE